MRIGAIAMQLEALLPAELPPGEAVRHVMNLEHAGLVQRVADRGFSLIELSGDLGMFLPRTFAPAAIGGLLELKAERRLSYTVHLPLWSVEPSTPLEPVRRGSVQATIDCIAATLPLEPERYVLHATGALAAEVYRMNLSGMVSSLILRQFQFNARTSIKEILAATDIPSRLLAIETIQFPFDLTLELAEDLDLSICLDVGHILAGFSGAVTVSEALEHCLPRLGEIHLHDCPYHPPGGPLGYGQDHRPLGRGDLNVGGLVDALEMAGWEGPIILELKLHESLESLDVIRAIRPAALMGVAEAL